MAVSAHGVWVQIQVESTTDYTGFSRGVQGLGPIAYHHARKTNANRRDCFLHLTQISRCLDTRQRHNADTQNHRAVKNAPTRGWVLNQTCPGRSRKLPCDTYSRVFPQNTRTMDTRLTQQPAKVILFSNCKQHPVSQ